MEATQEQIQEIQKLLALKRKAGLHDLFFFSKHIAETDESRKRFIVEHVHREWSRWYHHSRSRIKCILVPRGTFKSTFFTVNRVLQELADPEKRKDARILIANATLSVSQSFLGEVKNHIKGNEEYQRLYGNLYSKDLKWTETEIDIVGRATTNRYPSVEAVGVGGNLVGKHNSLIIADDLVNLENSATRLQSEKVIDWWKRSLSVLDPDGEMIIVGTRWAYFELYSYLLEQVETGKLDVDFFIRGAYRSDGTPYFPELLGHDKLEELKNAQGSYIFSAFYLNDPVDEDSAIIKASQLKYWREGKDGEPYDVVLPSKLNVFSLCDPAVSQSTFADYSTIVTAGIDERDNWYILDVKRGKWTVAQLIEELFEVYSQWNPITMTIEVVGQAQGLLEPIHREEEERNLFLPLKEIRVRPDIKKEMRIRAILQPRFERGKIFLKRGEAALEEELLKFPKSKHDDIIDPLTDLENIGFAADPGTPDFRLPGSKLEAKLLVRHSGGNSPYDDVMGEYY